MEFDGPSLDAYITRIPEYIEECVGCGEIIGDEDDICGDDEPYCLTCYSQSIYTEIINEVPPQLWRAVVEEIQDRLGDE